MPGHRRRSRQHNRYLKRRNCKSVRTSLLVVSLPLFKLLLQAFLLVLTLLVVPLLPLLKFVLLRLPLIVAFTRRPRLDIEEEHRLGCGESIAFDQVGVDLGDGRGDGEEGKSESEDGEAHWGS